MPKRVLFIWLLVVAAAGCDLGLSPPDEPATGTLQVDITYAGHPDAWPPRSELRDLLFVAMRFVPRDTTDLLDLSRMVLSGRLDYEVPEQTIAIERVPVGFYPYAGVAQKFGPGTFDWRPVGLVESEGGFFVVQDETTFVHVTVDFLNPPPFPPPDA